MTAPVVRVGIISGYPAQLEMPTISGAQIELHDIRHALAAHYRERYGERFTYWAEDVPTGASIESLHKCEVVTGDQFVPTNLHVLAPAMRWYHTATSGIDHLRFQPLWQTGVLLSSNCGVTGTGTIAEFVLALLLHASRRLSPQYSADVPYLGRRGELRTYPLDAADIAIVGTGGIGRAVEKVLSPLAGCLTLIGRDDDLEEGLKDANYVVVACPLTERTHAAIGERAADLVSADCVIVNVARREIVDEPAIAATTAQGHLRGYWAEGYQCWSDPDDHLDHGPAAGRSIAIAPDYPLAKERWRLFEQALAHYVRTASPPRLVDRARMY